jgi:hypothetical protein
MHMLHTKRKLHSSVFLQFLASHFPHLWPISIYTPSASLCWPPRPRLTWSPRAEEWNFLSPCPQVCW